MKTSTIVIGVVGGIIAAVALGWDANPPLTPARFWFSVIGVVMILPLLIKLVNRIS